MTTPPASRIPTPPRRQRIGNDAQVQRDEQRNDFDAFRAAGVDRRM